MDLNFHRMKNPVIACPHCGSDRIYADAQIHVAIEGDLVVADETEDLSSSIAVEHDTCECYGCDRKWDLSDCIKEAP